MQGRGWVLVEKVSGIVGYLSSFSPRSSEYILLSPILNLLVFFHIDCQSHSIPFGFFLFTILGSVICETCPLILDFANSITYFLPKSSSSSNISKSLHLIYILYSNLKFSYARRTSYSRLFLG